ncbi:MAG TPA: hypothetical protein ENJ00_05065 [Phycisphaerales bacterium]|nr:hypothetical protein [Phycisphaerales bacterium]
MRWTLLRVACLSAFLLGGCSSPQPFSADAPARGLSLGVRLPAEGMRSAEFLYSHDPIIARYQQYRGSSRKASKRRVERRVSADDAGNWLVEWFRLPSSDKRQPKLERSTTYHRGGDGSVLAARATGDVGSYTSVFDPPVRLSLALMKPGDRVESTFVTRAVNTRGKQVDFGPSSSWSEYAGRQRIITPLGTFDADVVLTHWQLDLGVGKVERNERTWIATILPGRTTVVAQDISSEYETWWGTGRSKQRLVIESVVR